MTSEHKYSGSCLCSECIKQRKAFWDKFDKDRLFHKKVKTAMTKNLRNATKEAGVITAKSNQDKVFYVKCKKCGVEMEACDGFEPLYCANCVFGIKCKKCQREGCNLLTKDLYCSQVCKDIDDSDSAQREAEWQSNEQNQVISESEI